VILSNRNFIETPGVIERVTRPLAENHINILEISTMKADILLFVDWPYKDIVYKLVSNSLAKMENNNIINNNNNEEIAEENISRNIP
jgi:aspartate kinase